MFIANNAHGQIVVGGSDYKEEEVASEKVVNPNALKFGAEVDVLPFALKGFIGTIWGGWKTYRFRFSYAQSDIPSFVLSDGILNDRVSVVGLNFEVFQKENFEGLWVGPGVGIWNNEFRFDQATADSTNRSFVFSFGAGYNWFFYKNFYVSPWAAVHTRVTGLEPIKRGRVEYQPARFTPELSLKVGIRFGK